jgi:nuclear pore complex protein Nup188
MATLTDRTYFPPLEECLSGKKIIMYVALVRDVSTTWKPR